MSAASPGEENRTSPGPGDHCVRQDAFSDQRQALEKLPPRAHRQAWQRGILGLDILRIPVSSRSLQTSARRPYGRSPGSLAGGGASLSGTLTGGPLLKGTAPLDKEAATHANAFCALHTEVAALMTGVLGGLFGPLCHSHPPKTGCCVFRGNLRKYICQQAHLLKREPGSPPCLSRPEAQGIKSGF